jgi:hypothetical protein
LGFGVVETATAGVAVATTGVVVVPDAGVVVAAGLVAGFEGSKAKFFDIHDAALIRVSSVIALHH